MILDDLLERLPLARRELERQDLPRGLADAIVHADAGDFAIRRRLAPPGQYADMKQKCFFEDQTPLRRCRESVDLVD